MTRVCNCALPAITGSTECYKNCNNNITGATQGNITTSISGTYIIGERYCGSCPNNDGLCYTSDPPKYRCTITGEFHHGFDKCNVLSQQLMVDNSGDIINHDSAEDKLNKLLNELNEFIDIEYPDETDYFGQGITETAILEAKEEWLGQLINIVESYR